MLDELLEKAHRGDVKAQCSLALMYEIGVSGKVDLVEAFNWWSRAAGSGDPVARAKVSEYLSKGTAGIKDLSAAVEHAKKAEAQGFGAYSSTAKTARQRREYKVLVVSSEMALINKVMAYLEEAGYRIASASNAPDAVKVCNDNLDANLLLLDLHMVGFSGFNLLSTVKQCNFIKKPKFVMMTRKVTKDEVAAGNQLGVDSWLVRPIRKPQLLKAVDALLVSGT